MTRVLAISSMLSEPLSTPLIQRALGRGAEQPDDRVRADQPTLEAIQDAVCRVHGLSRAELLSPRRSPRIAHARQIGMYLTRELTDLSLSEIARGFDRDHTTVLHAIRAVTGRLDPGSETVDAIHTVRSELGVASPSEPPPSTDSGADPQLPHN